MNYIVAWALIVFSSNNPHPETDRFGRVGHIVYTVNAEPDFPLPQVKKFTCHDEAMRFYRDCRKEAKVYGDITNISIDSIKKN